MDDLIFRRLSGRATDLEVRTVERWLAESEDHARRYREIEALWTVSELPDEGAPPSLDEITGQAEERRRKERAKAGRKAALRSPWIGYGLAAAAIVALLIVRNDAGDVPRLTPVESTASSGDVTTMGLSDGSVVRVAGSTTVEFPPSRNRREVVLDGRAFFAVTEAEVPFVVRTALGEVTVLGTRFEVAVDDEELRLIVVEGVVTATGAGTSVRVGAGQMAQVTPESGARLIEGVDVWEMLDWEGGLLLFESTPLASVAAEMARHFGVAIDVAPALRERRVTAWFTDEDLGEVTRAVCLVAGASCAATDTGIAMEPGT